VHGIMSPRPYMGDNATKHTAVQLFDTSFSAANLKSTYVQSFYFLGLPLAGYSNPADDFEEQRKEGDEYMVEINDDLKERFGFEAGAYTRSLFSST